MKKKLGTAKKIRIREPFATQAWDCRQLGFGRVVAPELPIAVEIAPGVQLHLCTGAVTASSNSMNALDAA